MIVNNQLREKRNEVGLTQVEIAEKANISEVSYQRLEYGSRKPSLNTALLIAKILHSTVEDLFGAATLESTKKPDGNPADVCV